MLVNGKHAPETKSSNSIPSTYVGELVHSDTKGPLKCESVGGCKYQCVIIGDYSNFARVYNIKSKKQTLECLDKFRMLLSKHGHTIKAMRSDYGTEYFNMRTEHWCAKHHISNSSSSPHRHHQNSKPERFWQTLWNMNRASIDYMHEHESMWSVATNCNEFILIRGQ